MTFMLPLLNTAFFPISNQVVLNLLHELGVDLTKPCDDMSYGAPAFWASKYGREHCLLELFSLGIDLNAPCERYGKDAYQVVFTVMSVWYLFR